MSFMQPHYIPKMFQSAREAEVAVADWGWHSRRYGPDFIKFTKGSDKSLKLFAKQSGVSPAYLSSVMKGDRVMTPAAFLKIVEGCHMYDYNRAISAHRIEVKKLEDTT